MKSDEIQSEDENFDKLFQKYRVYLGQNFLKRQSDNSKNNGDVEDNKAFLHEEIVKTPVNCPNCTDHFLIKQASSSNEQAFEIGFDNDNSNIMKDFGHKKQAPVNSHNSLQEKDEPIAVEEENHESIAVEEHHELIAVEERHEPNTVEQDHHEPITVEEDHHEPITVEEDHHERIIENQELINEMEANEIRKDSYHLAMDFFIPKFTIAVVDSAEISKKMFVVDSDLKFFNDYVNMMRDPKSYQIKVTRIFRLSNLHPSHRGIDYLKNHTLLMHGVHHNNLFKLLQKGFKKSNGASSKRMYFGRGFYFNDCSTKAFNFSSQHNAYNFERKADNGECRPKIDDFGYILMCNVALGRETLCSYPMKHNDSSFTNGDSLKSVSKYQAKKSLHLQITKKVVSQTVTLPYGGFYYDQKEVNKNPKITNFADYCVFDPNLIEMQWLLEVQRVS